MPKMSLYNPHLLVLSAAAASVDTKYELSFCYLGSLFMISFEALQLISIILFLNHIGLSYNYRPGPYTNCVYRLMHMYILL